MHSVCVCYSLDGSGRPALDALADRLRAIDEGAASAGFRTFAHVRDSQHWRGLELDPLAALNAVLREIDTSFAVLLDLTPHETSRFTGLSIEAGYALARGKPLVAIWPVNVTPPAMLRGITTLGDQYRDERDIPACVRRLLAKVVTNASPVSTGPSAS